LPRDFIVLNPLMSKLIHVRTIPSNSDLHEIIFSGI